MSHRSTEWQKKKKSSLLNNNNSIVSSTMAASEQKESATSGTSSVGKCPVDHTSPSSLWKVLGVGGGSSNSKGSQDSSPPGSSNKLPASLEEAAQHAQSPHPGQRLPLSTYRSESTIPRGQEVENKPHHQLGFDSSRWVYPSEQQVFNAMKRKGWGGIEEEAIPSFLQVHNSVNERSWRELCNWESNRGSNNHDNIQLVRFEGRPKDLSPKAWIWSNLLFQERPFDRHDWYIDNGVDHEKRYVLDFYMTEDDTARGGMPRVEIDVRPALDTPQAFVQRSQRILYEVFPGIARELEKFSQLPPQDS